MKEMKMKSEKKVVISKASQAVIDAFDDAARAHGYQESEGHGAAVGMAQADYEVALTALIKRVALLEKRAGKKP